MSELSTELKLHDINYRILHGVTADRVSDQAWLNQAIVNGSGFFVDFLVSGNVDEAKAMAYSGLHDAFPNVSADDLARAQKELLVDCWRDLPESGKNSFSEKFKKNMEKLVTVDL